MTLDKQKLEELRARAGLTQPELEKRSGSSLRTVQRALAGDPVRPYMAKRIAEALGVELADIVASDGHALEQDMSHVLAWKVRGGMAAISALANAQIRRVEVNAEPSPDIATDIIEIAAALHAMNPEPEKPSSPYEDGVPPGKVEQVRMAADINGRLERLAAAKVAIYVGTYVALAHEVYYDGNDGFWTSSHQKKNLPAAVVVVSHDAGERILVPVNNRSHDDPALRSPPINENEDEEDDRPF